jgi:hypothetical protein
MARKRIDPQAIEEEVAALGGLPITVLRERWKAVWNSAAQVAASRVPDQGLRLPDPGEGVRRPLRRHQAASQGNR